MKKKIYILLLFLSSTLISCDDYLDVQPKNVLTVQGVKDVKMMVGSYLNRVERMSYSGYNLFSPLFGATSQTPFREFEDDLDFSGMADYQLPYFEKLQFQWRYDGFEYGIWTGLYNEIGNFNLFLYEIDRIGDTSNEMMAIKAEVLMNRALYYLRLAQYFCPYRGGQYVSDPERYGLPVVSIDDVENLANDSYPVRLNQQETYEFILNDLKAIEEMNVNPVGFNLFYNKRAFYGLMAEFYMWRAESPAKEAGDWENARTYAEKSIGGQALISSPSELMDLLNPIVPSASAPLRFTMDNRYKYGTYFYKGWSTIVVYNEVYNMYDMDDIRRTVYINPSSRRIDKFDQADAANKIIMPMWRVAEMKLIIAESYIREGDSGNALAYLNEFKQSRIPSFTSYTGGDILDEILRERRKEFLCETNYRWLDMKRNGVVYSRTTSTGVTHTLEADDYRYSFRIPLVEELELNPNNFQNPHWDLVEETEY